MCRRTLVQASQLQADHTGTAATASNFPQLPRSPYHTLEQRCATQPLQSRFPLPRHSSEQHARVDTRLKGFEYTTGAVSGWCLAPLQLAWL
jgi:hypothetical protein